MLYSPSLQILRCLKDQFFFLKWLQIDSDLSCQTIEIPSSFFFNVTFSAFIFTVLPGKKTGVTRCLFKVLSQGSCITRCFCYPGILHRSNVVVVICIWLCYFVCFFSPGPNLEVQENNPTTLETEAGASQQVQGLSGLPRKF